MDAVSLNLSGKSYYPGPGVKKEELCSLEVSLLAPILRMFKTETDGYKKVVIVNVCSFFCICDQTNL